MEARRQLEGEKRSRGRASEQLQELKQRSRIVGRNMSDSAHSVHSGNTMGSKFGKSVKKFRHLSGEISGTESSSEDEVFVNLSPSSSHETLSTAWGQVAARTPVREGPHLELLTSKEREEAEWTRQALECGEKLKDLQLGHIENMKHIDESNNVIFSAILLFHLSLISPQLFLLFLSNYRRKYLESEKR